MWTKMIRVGALVGVLVAAAGCAVDTGTEATATTQELTLRPPAVVVPNFEFRNESLYGQLGARWWQWVYSLPIARSPLFDATGEHCDEGQSGAVWFLVGTLASEDDGPTTRRCTIPFGRSLFFPIVNAGYDPWGVDPAPTNDFLRDDVARTIDGATELTVLVDGVALRNLQRGRGAAGPFSYRIPAGGDDLLAYWGYPGAPPVVDRAFSDGYWMMLAPLAPGRHRVSFGGRFADGTRIDVSYDLTIARPR